MYGALGMVGTRATLFATVAWQLCVAPVWVSQPGTAQAMMCVGTPTRCGQVSCRRSPCPMTKVAAATRVINCRSDCAGRCERLDKGVGNKTEPTQPWPAPQACVRGSAFHHRDPDALRWVERHDVPAQPDRDLLRTVVLIM